MSDEEPFLQRWSRRKSAARQGAVEPEAPEGRASGEASAETCPPPAEEDLSQIDFAALDFRSDYQRFLAPGVPEAIKNKALRRLWESDPMFTAADPYQDYQGDYSDAAVGVAAGALKTAYRIGQGFIADQELGRPKAHTEATASDASLQEGAEAEAGELLIAEATAADHRDLEALEARFLPLPADGSGWPSCGSPAARHVLARAAGLAVGFGQLRVGPDGRGLARIFVVPEALAAGVTSQILAWLEEAAKGLLLRVITLELGAAQQEEARLLRRLGYGEPQAYGDCREAPAHYLEKRIG